MSDADKIVTVEVQTVDNPFGSEAIQVQPDAGTMAEVARAQQEIQAAVIMARRFPRDEFSAMTRIITACKRHTLASEALYAYPRGKDAGGKAQIVKGPSIRLAEVIAQAWGNLRYGITELERTPEKSLARAYAWDLETNVAAETVFEVPHTRHTKTGSYKLSDPRDIYENLANSASRRLRSCILRIIPQDVVERAEQQVVLTLKSGSGAPLQDRIREMVIGFSAVGVPQDAIEKRLGHALDITTEDELIDLRTIYQAVKDNFASRFGFFDLKDAASETTKELNKKFAKKVDKSEPVADDDTWLEGK
jgi:hypothetical protein